MEPWVPDPVVSDVHDHERQEAREETEEDGQHQGGEAGVFFFLFCGLSAEFAVEREKDIILHILVSISENHILDFVCYLAHIVLNMLISILTFLKQVYFVIHTFKHTYSHLFHSVILINKRFKSA